MAKYDKTNPVHVVAEHYLIAAVWADAPEGTRPRVTAQATEKARRIAWQFLEIIGPDTLKACEDAYRENGYGSHPDCGDPLPWCAAMGYDLWLTSQGHGAGFFDRDELPAELGQRLTKDAGKFSGIYPEFYRGWLYLHGSMPMVLVKANP